ncbi:MAG: hypothetical protein JXA96_03670 [Sedimentisphaerales bacterium]|nr:hypothetical protein [Sedimentisphaerales bacterium]
MYIERNRVRLFKRSIFILLLLSCIINANASELKNNVSPNNDLFVKFADSNSASGDYSVILKQLCEETEIGTIHSYRYYKNTGQLNSDGKAPQVIKAQKILKGLANIAYSYMMGKIDSQIRLANLEELVLLEKHVLNAKPLGVNNIQLADSISMLIDALIFQEEAVSKTQNLEKIKSYLERNILETYYTPQVLSDIFEREINYKSETKYDSQYDLIINMLIKASPEFAKNYTNKKGILNTIMSYMMTSYKSDPEKSRNSFIDIDPFDFSSNFFAVRYAESCTRFSLDWLKRPKDPNDTEKSYSFYLQFQKQLPDKMTDFEKQIFGNPETENEKRDVILEIIGQIRDNTSSEGKRILEQEYRRFLHLSSKNDLPELKS